MISGNQQVIALGPMWQATVSTLSGDVAGRIDASGEKIAIQFYATTTNAITAVDQLIDFVGNTSGVTWQLGIYSDSAGAPNTLLTGASATFAGPAASVMQWAGGGTNPLTLGTSTGILTLNQPYWIVLEVSAGTPGVSNYAQMVRFSGGLWVGRGITYRLYTGGSWGAAGTTRVPVYMLKHGATGYHGFPTSNSFQISSNPAIDVFGNNRQGLKCIFGSKVNLIGVAIRTNKTGSPANLVIAVYEGSTPIGTSELSAATVYNSSVPQPLVLTAPIIVNKATDVYIVLRQKGSTSADNDGGNDTNDYDLQVAPIVSAYWESQLPSTWSYVYGTGNDPTTYTSTQTVLPTILPLIADPTVDLSVPAGGGGMLVHPGMVGGMRG